jgi:hypothetical protein
VTMCFASKTNLLITTVKLCKIASNKPVDELLFDGMWKATVFEVKQKRVGKGPQFDGPV